MRTMLKASFPVAAGNKGIKDGSLPQLLQSMIDELHPEAAYFFADERGQRSALMVFDLKEPSQIPFIAERFFSGTEASIQMAPVMNAEDLRKGLDRLQKGNFKGK